MSKDGKGHDSADSDSADSPEVTQTRAAEAGYPDRLDEVSNSLEGLHDALNSHETLENVLHRLAETTVQAFPGAEFVTITIMRDGRLYALTATDPRATPLDQQQTEAGGGPHQEAIRDRRPVRVELDAHTRQRWPEFSNTASTAGVAAYLSAPLFTATDHDSAPVGDSGELLGMLNIYGDKPDAFDPFDEALLRLLTTTASAAIINAGRDARTREMVDQLQQAIESRPPIEQAKGVLMAIHSIDPDTAFNMLVEQSQQTHTKLHTIARRLLDSL